MSLPSGTITFLFTDIEGSTQLWEQYPEGMRTALARHDALLRQAIEDNDGFVFKTVGDAYCAAFATAAEALSAALTAQCALHSERWPEPLSLRVRVALHTGAAELRDNDYFGQPLNRVARLLAIGHGGQVLLSEVARDLTQDLLPPAATLLSLGEHRLRDLGRPEPVFQLLHPQLPGEFPPLRSLDNPDLPNNLPLQVTSFVGREKEMEEIKSLLRKTRLLTLTGSGGCGKTRLSLQVAAEVLEHYPQGVWLVELAPLADPALVAPSLAQALKVTEEPGKPLLQTLVDFLKAKRLLLVLDNCEHLLDACAHLVNTLIRACPHLQVMVSSREGLSIAGETVYRIPSLSLPDLKQNLTPSSLETYEAVRLFVDRAIAALPGFVVTNANAPALASVCRRLDGIPLAIELAAARVRSLSVEEINHRLDNRFRLLTGGSRTALPRQQTLRALIDWSYDLLTAPEKALLCRLSVFAGGWLLPAAEAVGAGAEIEEWEVLDLLTSVADKSLVVTETQAEQTRYRLLETVRQYARDRLMESGESLRVMARHRDYFLNLAEEGQLHLNGPDQAKWLEILEEEHDNLRLALTFCLEETEGGEKGLRLGAALQRFWWTYGYVNEGREHLSAVLMHAGGQEHTRARAVALESAGLFARLQSDYTLARALFEERLTIDQELGDKVGIASSLSSLGTLALVQSDYTSARSLFEESLTLYQELGDRIGIAGSLGHLGNMAIAQGDYASARSLLSESLAIGREEGHNRAIASSLGSLGTLALVQGDYASARSLFEEILAINREYGNELSIARSVSNLGEIAYEEGDYVSARALQEESLKRRRELGDKIGIVVSMSNLGNAVREQGDYTMARSLYAESLAMAWELGHKIGVAYSLDAFAYLAIHEEAEKRCVRLLGAASALRDAIDFPLPLYERERQKQAVAAMQKAMDEATFTAAWEEGRAMTSEQAVTYALREEK